MIILASKNAGKLKEFKKILPAFSIVSMAEVGFFEEIEENGSTFEENACIKAMAVWKATGKPSIADDSGLMVDALDGAPGIYSARYAGEDATDAQRMEKLLFEMKDVPDAVRGATFVSVIAFVDETGTAHTFRGECRGFIGDCPKGDGGFGYDPLFFVPSLGKTFSELSDEEKNANSHRGRALQLFAAFMKKEGAV